MSTERSAVGINRQTASLPENLREAVEATLADWSAHDKVQKLWAGDSSLWSGDDENEWVGWLQITSEQLAEIEHLTSLADEIKGEGFSHVLLLGMGGSSLCPEVMSLTFGKIPGFPQLHVLDSTDPAQIKTREHEIDLTNSLFIVSSKSGRTLEPNIFKDYFFDRAKQVVGEEAGRRFVAITDPGSDLQRLAEDDHFRHILFGRKNIGGRYSALSDFGMAPAAIMGVDVRRLLTRTQLMVDACSATGSAGDNPGVVLGAILGTAATKEFGRDKVTIIASPGIHDLGAWLEQLIAESTGKEGRGLIPVDRERLGKSEVYGGDRVFAYLRLTANSDAVQDEAIAALERAGHPVMRIEVDDIYNLGQEFFRWEIATSVACSIIERNPFNQPDVEYSKDATRELTDEYELTGKLRDEATPVFEDEGIKLFTDQRNVDELRPATSSDLSLVGYLRAHLDRLKAGDYLAVLAYLEMNEEHETALQELRHAVRDRKRVATCLGFGPRFLHSTGQAYKGGPASGVFLQITCDDAEDLAVPGSKYTFGVVKAAQARGDFQVLLDRKRRAMRVHLGADVKAGLQRLNEAVKAAL
jgi:transaldolase/glucose-6-phosphate isomerase